MSAELKNLQQKLWTILDRRTNPLPADDQKILREFIRSGWRVLFDLFASEWNDLTLIEKSRLVAILTKEGYKVNELLEVYKRFWLDYGRPDIARAADVVRADRFIWPALTGGLHAQAPN